jgi:RNA polymerase sigma factor (sigma-70 family)
VKIPQLGKSDDFIPTRQSLLSRLKDMGDDASWQDFFYTYGKLIYGVAIRAGLTDSEAQEVVQETVISISRHMAGFKYDRAKGSFKGWLLKLTNWRIKDQLRKRQREACISRPLNDTSDATSPVEKVADPVGVNDAIWDEEWQKNLIEAALQKVRTKAKPKQYQIFDLYVLKQWPVAKVASALNVNIAQVYLAKHRVSSLLGKEMRTLEAKC